MTTGLTEVYKKHVLSEEAASGRPAVLLAGVTAVVSGVALAVVGALGAPEAAPVGHWSVFVGMALSLAGILAGRSPARDRAPASEVLRDAHR